MLRVKKSFSEQLLQVALLLSVIRCDRLWPTLTFGIICPSAPLSEVEVGSYLDHWGRNHGYSHEFGPSTQIHPKSVGRHPDWLLNELLSLGRYGDRYPSNIEAYLQLNEQDGNEKGRDDRPQEADDQVVKTEPKENDDNGDDDVAEASDTDIGEDVFMLAPEVSFFLLSVSTSRFVQTNYIARSCSVAARHKSKFGM